LIKSIQELTAYITEGTSTMSLRRNWTDPYTIADKEAFIALHSNNDTKINNKQRELQVLEPYRTTIPVDTKGESNNE
jgi:hypothetical protein